MKPYFIPPPSDRDYRVDRWLNVKTLEPLFGISVRIDHVWHRLAESSVAVISTTIEEAETKILFLRWGTYP